MIDLVCTHCGEAFARDRFRKFCSHACRAAYGSSTTGAELPRPRIPPRRRMDSELIGALFLSGWQGEPLLLADFAELFLPAKPTAAERADMLEDLELRGGVLAPWCVAVLSARGMVLCGRNIAYGELRAFLDGEAFVETLQEAA